MTFVYKIAENLASKYLQNYLLPQALNQYSRKSAKKNLLTILSSKMLSFCSTFFPYCINDWIKLNDNLRNANAIFKLSVKNCLTKFIKVKENSSFCVSDPLDLKLLTRLWLNFSYLNEHKFRYNFQDNVNSMSLCVLEVL